MSNPKTSTGTSISIVNPPPIATETKDSRTLYAASYTLTQKDMGYEMPKSGPITSTATKNVTVYADELTLSENLTLPGKTLTLISRKITLDKAIFIDVAAPAPSTTYTPGDKAPQINTAPAADGADGKAGSNGTNAGNINIAADHISATNAVSTESIIIEDQVEALMNKALSKIQSYLPSSSEIKNFSFPLNFDTGKETIAATVKIQGVNIKGMGKKPLMGNLEYNSYEHTVSVEMELSEITFGGMMSIDFTKPTDYSLNDLLFTVDPFNILLSVEFTLDPQTNKITKTTSTVYLSQPLILFLDIKNELASIVADFFLNVNFWTSFKEINAFIKSTLDMALGKVAAFYNNEAASKFKEKPMLYLYARGGSGGRGQDGNDGIWGAWTYFVIFIAWYYRKTGGLAGSPGSSGNGGNGGNISLNLVKQDPFVIVVNAEAGPGGAKAFPGYTGAGFPWQKRTPKSTGNFGKLGKAGKVEVNSQPFAINKPRPPFTRAQLGTLLNTDQLLFIQRLANYQYINGRSSTNFSQVSDYYVYLCDVNVASALAKLPTHDKAVRSAMYHSATVELMRLSRGLNYYGNTYNWVPEFDLTHLQTFTVTMIGLTKNIEEQYGIYMNEDSSTEDKINALNTALGKVNQQKSSLENLLNTVLPAKAKSTLKTIDNLTSTIENLLPIIQRDEAALLSAINSTFSGATCRNASPFVKCLGALVPIAVGVATENPIAIIGGVTSAGITLAGDGTTFAGQQSLAIKQFDNAKASFDDVVRVLKEIEVDITSENPDGGKMTILEKELDAQMESLIAKFGHSAADLSAAVNQLLYLNKSRNYKVVQYNGIFVQMGKIKGQLAQQNAEANRISDLLAKDKENLVPGPYITYLKNSLVWSYSYLLSQLYQQQRAFDYYSATTNPRETLNSLNIAYISDTQARLLKDQENYLSSHNVNQTDIKVPVTISAKKYPQAFKNFGDNKTLSFTLSLTEPNLSNFVLVRMSQLTMNFPSLKGIEGTLSVDIQLAGDYKLMPIGASSLPKAETFTSAARNVGLEFDCKSGTTTGTPDFTKYEEQVIYFPPSPFTRWQLKFSSTSPKVQSKLAEMTSFDIVIIGEAVEKGVGNFETIDRTKLDEEVLQISHELVREKGEGRMSFETAEILLTIIYEAGEFTYEKRQTIIYLLKNKSWTDEAKAMMMEELNISEEEIMLDVDRR